MDGVTIFVLWAIFLPFAGMFLSSILYLIKSYQLYFFLKKHNYSRWRDLTTMGKNPSNYFNPFKIYSYINSSLDNEEEQILRYKDSMKKHLRMFFSGILGVVVAVIFSIFVITKFG